MSLVKYSKDRPIGNIYDDQVEASAFHLKSVLSAENSLFLKTKGFEWNLKGRNHDAFRKFLGVQSRFIFQSMKELGDRIRILGEYSILSKKNYYLDEEIVTKAHGQESILNNLLDKNFRLVFLINEKIHLMSLTDYATKKMLKSILKRHQESCLSLKSHINRI